MNNNTKEAVMAKVRAHKITPDQIQREDLESILGVGARNIGIVEMTVDKVLAKNDPATVGANDFAVKGQISTDTAKNIAQWVRENVEDIDWDDEKPQKKEHQIVSTEEIFEEVEADSNGHQRQRPLLALTFDPEATVVEAAKFLTEHEDKAGDLGKRLALVQGWLRGEYLAPAPQDA